MALKDACSQYSWEKENADLYNICSFIGEETLLFPDD